MKIFIRFSGLFYFIYYLLLMHILCSFTNICLFVSFSVVFAFKFFQFDHQFTSSILVYTLSIQIVHENAL